MNQEQIKTLLINIATGAIVVGVVIALYLVFTKSSSTAPTSISVNVAPASDVIETARISAEVKRTVDDLSGIESTVSSSIVIFGAPEFQNLKDFSMAIPEDNARRLNPFVPTDWKIKLKSLETNTNTQTVQLSDTQTVLTSPVLTAKSVASTTNNKTPASVLGDFGASTSQAL